jgi:hypothetical protein
MKALILIVLFATTSFAKTDWVCSRSSGYRSGGNTFYICGQGSHPIDETRAKVQALHSAFDEFAKLCSLSDCRNREVLVTQHRTDCALEKGHYECLRMIEFEVTKKLKEVDPVETSPDFSEGDIENEKIYWNSATATDLTNFSLTLGYQAQSGTLKEYKNLTGSGLYFGASKRLLKYIGIQVAGQFGRAETNSQKPTTLDYSGYLLGLPFYYAFEKNEISLSPGYYSLSSSIEKNNQKISNQRQAGFGIEAAYSRLFYFSKNDQYYLGISPRLAVINYGDSQDFKSQKPVIMAIFGVTVGFR